MSDRMYKTVRLPTYAEGENFQEHDIRYHAYAVYHDFEKAIRTTPDPDLPDEDMDIDEVTDPKVKKALQ